jgi:hypothetical protein
MFVEAVYNNLVPILLMTLVVLNFIGYKKRALFKLNLGISVVIFRLYYLDFGGEYVVFLLLAAVVLPLFLVLTQVERKILVSFALFNLLFIPVLFIIDAIVYAQYIVEIVLTIILILVFRGIFHEKISEK